jgi:catechol 2,3-dioxygenase-like lactoylglutathione lyase family enzyme
MFLKGLAILYLTAQVDNKVFCLMLGKSPSEEAAMAILDVDHVNVTTSDLERMRRFYTEVLGLKEGVRPPFTRPGAWMYLGERAVVHISTGRVPAGQSSDAFDHIAFKANDLEATRAQLRLHGVAFTEFGVPDRQLHQLFLRDPEGMQIELVFSGEDARIAREEGAAVDVTQRGDLAKSLK